VDHKFLSALKKVCVFVSDILICNVADLHFYTLFFISFWDLFTVSNKEAIILGSTDKKKYVYETILFLIL
jgi:hypothetical protein